MLKPSLLALLLASLPLLACDPGYDYDLEVTVPDAIAAEYDEQSRGLLVIESEGQSAHWIVCGAEAEPIVARIVDGGGLGCPESLEIKAFIAPLDATDARACGQLAEPDYGIDIASIDPAWPQASVERRNPCDHAGELVTLSILAPRRRS